MLRLTCVRSILDGRFPFIHIAGDWLLEAGFTPDSKIIVEEQHGQIVIRLIEDEYLPEDTGDVPF